MTATILPFDRETPRANLTKQKCACGCGQVVGLRPLDGHDRFAGYHHALKHYRDVLPSAVRVVQRGDRDGQ
jgi:hypothetical protein